jgi:hypothetical protein
LLSLGRIMCQQIAWRRRTGESLDATRCRERELYEAAVLAMKAFEIAEWSELPRGTLEILVTSPAVKHEVSIAKVTSWLRVVRNPQDQVLKSRLREILGWRD